VWYEGTEITADISVSACVHDLFAESSADILHLTLNDTRRLWDSWNPKAGERMKVTNGAANIGALYVRQCSPQNGLYEITASSVPETMQERRTKSWASVRFLQLAEEIASHSGLTFKTYGVTDQQYKFVAQENRSDAEFLQQRCVLEGCAFLVYDGALILYSQKYMEQQKPQGILTVASDSEFVYKDKSGKLFGGAKVSNGGFTGNYVANPLSQIYKSALPVYISNQEEADRFARGVLRDLNKGGITATLQTGLLCGYAPGSTVKLQTSGAASYDGTWFITHMRNDYAAGTTKLFLRKPLEGY
jgi:hypothetical protein